MVKDADLVLAFVTPADLSGTSGTMHVVESAIAQGKPCRLYLVEVSLIGS
jgi:nucleoside 2-deoxyribosyltransferase